METASGPQAMSPGHMDDEKYFLIFHGIMNVEEFIEFTDNRKALYQKILSGKATKEELLVQINLESILLQTCRHQIEQIMKETNTKDFNTEVTTILSNRINDLYILLFRTFKFDVILVLNYTEFCSKNEKLTINSKTVLDEIMDSFHSDPEMYIIGVRHALNHWNDIESARRYISIGIKFYDDIKKLHVEDFWIEVKNLSRKGETSFQKALKKYNYIILHFEDDLNLHIDLLDKALDENIKMTKLQCILIRDMVDKYRRNEFMWQKLAKIHLKGFVYNYDTEILQKIPSLKKSICIKNCIDTYDKALTQNLSPIIQQNVWDLFLDELVEIHNSVDKEDQVNKDFINNMINRTFTEAYSTYIMKKPRHFIFWAKRQDNEDSEVAVLKKGVKISTDSVELWTMLFEYYIHHDFLRNAMDVLFESASIIRAKSLPLWETMELYVLSTDEEMIEDFYRECSIALRVDEINLRFRPEYLEWRVLTYDIVSGRQVFSNLKCLEPKCHDLYKRMLRFETLNIVSKGNKHIKYMRKLYSEACNLFGHMDVELWYDCIRFEYMYGIPSLVDVIFEAGVNLLEKPSFKAELSEMKYELDAQFKSDEVIHIEDDK